MPNNWLNNRKRRPTHPGEILREDFLPAAGLTQDKLARVLGVSRRTVSEILRAETCYDRHGTPLGARLWHVARDVLGLQQDVDLWDTHLKRRVEYDRIKRVPTSKAA